MNMATALNQVRHPMPGVVYAPAADLQRYTEVGALTQETMGQAFRASFARHAQRVALCSAEGATTYAELDAQSERLGAALLRLGLEPLDRVVFQINNCQELVLGFVACLKAGLIPICTLAVHREHEIGYLGQHAQARLHFVQGDDPRFDDVAFAQEMRAQIPTMRWTLQARGECRGDSLSLRELIASVTLDDARRELAALDLDPYQVAVFQLSGGTTGVPKIIPRFHNEYIYNMRSVASFLGYRDDDCMFIPMPMVHNLNMGCCFGPMLLKGATVAIAAGLDPEALGEVFRKFQPTWTVLAGPLLQKLKPLIRSGQLPLTRLRRAISPGGAPALRELLGVPVHHVFGMTEGVIMFTQPDDPQEVQDAMVGRPISAWDQVKLLKTGTDEPLDEAGVEGECVFAGPYTIHGYFDAEERNAQAFTRDGFYRSGDLMLFRDIGGQRYYEFRGRTKDVVDRAGEKVNCEEVERLVNRHPSVQASAVVGMPDKVYGERICAFVQLREGATAPGVAELGKFLAELGVAKFKWPERIEALAELPLTKVGKLNKTALKDLIASKLAAEAPPGKDKA